MDATELTQFIAVCVIALAALVAAPIVAWLAESSDHRSARPQRRISTQHPVMQ